jgi:uncharacterized protein YgiM (DUF1202 family)
MHRLKIFFPVLALSLAALACSLTQPQGGAVVSVQNLPEVTPTQAAGSLSTVTTPPGTTTPTAAQCTVTTGIDAGTVNLRSCAGVGCAVVLVLTEGEPLTMLTPGVWAQVQTGEGVTGWINAKYCK